MNGPEKRSFYQTDVFYLHPEALITTPHISKGVDTVATLCGIAGFIVRIITRWGYCFSTLGRGS
jgi:hypothetical protein